MVNKEDVKSSEPIEQMRSKLIDCEVVLNPKKSGMYVDDVNKITLDFFKDGRDRIKFTEKMDPTPILKNVRFGILRILKNGKDISESFGGQKDTDDWRFKPVVNDAPRKIDLEDKQDKALYAILNRANSSQIIRDIRSIKEYKVIERLLEIEKAGKNLSFSGRRDVIDALEEQLKVACGPGNVTKDDKKNEEVVVK